MKDLDFDELDRAVNSLMSDVPKTNMPKPDDIEKTLDITPTISEGAKPVFGKIDEAATRAINTPVTSLGASHSLLPKTSSPPTPLAARRGGRFMDVVHPSSDMKKSIVSTRSVSRQGITIDPSHTNRSIKPSFHREMPVLSKEETPIPPEPVVIDTPATDDTPTPVAPGEWPDPLDVANFKDTEPTPLTTPFLPDTKVEKRPLGNSMPSVTALLEEPEHSPVLGMKAEEPAATVDDPNDQLLASPADIEPQLPEELQNELMVVEADTHMGMPKTENAETMSLPPSAPIGKESEPATEPKVVSKPSMPSMSLPDEPLLGPGPTSIPQQYHEEPSTGDQANGSIYDTDTYHQPLTHPAKKKSGWMWVVWILLILLVGAGAGAALYFAGIV